MYEIKFEAITTNGEVVGNLTFRVSKFVDDNIVRKARTVQRLCVEYARCMNIACSFASILSIKEV